MKWLIYGSNGWIGNQLKTILNDQDEIIIEGKCRVDNTQDVNKEIKLYCPDRVICLIGRTHGENYTTIDYLEQDGKLVENIRDNLFAPISLAMICQELNIHLTYLGTGCIFSDEVPENTNGYNENDIPNFTGSSYSTVKGFTDRLMHMFTNVLNVRIRMPIIGENHPRNFITKIASYKKVVNVQNSMTVLPELLPIMIDLARKSHIGTINLTNPGTISHNEILDLYKSYVDENFTYENFTIEEQNTILRSKRSNNKLDTTLLESLYPNVNSIKNSVINIFKTYLK